MKGPVRTRESHKFLRGAWPNFEINQLGSGGQAHNLEADN